MTPVAPPDRVPIFPPYRPTVGALIQAAAERSGDRTFAVLGDERLTYAEVEARSAALARGLLAAGAGKGTRVGLLAPNGPDWIVGWLGAARTGAVVALLNTYAPARELGWMLRHADVQVLLTADRHVGHDYLARLEQAIPDLAGQPPERIMAESHPYLRAVWTWGAGKRPWAGPVEDLAGRGVGVPAGILRQVEVEVSPADPAVVVYSSGSTSDPKGAVHSHGALVRHAHNLGQMRDLTGSDVLYTPMPLFWVGGLSFTLVAAMHVGATLVFEERFEPEATLDLIEREQVTQVLGWPHVAKALADHPTFADRDLSAVRAGTIVEYLPHRAALGADVPTATSLGMTETLGPHTYADKTPLPSGKEGSFGFSVPGVEHKVVDPVTLEEVPTGSTGELWMRGYSLMLGLHKRERQDVFTPDGWYRTGDGGYFDEDGHFFFTGRMGDLIKSSGMNVTPRDVELVLEAMPEVALAFVTGIPHPDRGEDVVAAVALGAGASLDEAEVRARAKADLASYKIPRHVAVFASQSELPWLDSGKVDRRKLAAILREQFEQGTGESSAETPERGDA